MAHTSAAGSGADDRVGEIPHGRNLLALTVGAIGVVYGDIGTSPLYAFREAVVAASHGSFANRDAVLGVLSLIIFGSLFVGFTIQTPLLADEPRQVGIALKALTPA